jgi:glutathione synthase/RimK-type ligase-like ATP-grasp enzyme
MPMKSATTNKWFKYWYLKRARRLSHYVPETRILSQKNLWLLISKYRHVIVKPIRGSRGRGVIQVSSLGNHEYALHYEKTKITLQGKDSTYQYIKSKTDSTSYMVQRLISRPTIDGRPFDMRVIIQRRRNSPVWKVTAKVAKVAGEGYIVSNNTRSGGDLLLVKKALRKSSIHHLSKRKLLFKIDKIALRATRRLAKYFNGHRIYGMDMGPDQRGHIWIIEANLFPARSHFRKLKDKTMYRRITSYKYD